MKLTILSAVCAMVLLTGCNETKEEKIIEPVKVQKIKETKTMNDVQNAISKATKEVTNTANKLTQQISSKLAESKGSVLYNKCQSCHGSNGNLNALGKSKSIAGWDISKLEKSLQAYKSGNKNEYGMGGLMNNQVASLNDSEITELAKHINSLGK